MQLIRLERSGFRWGHDGKDTGAPHPADTAGKSVGSLLCKVLANRSMLPASMIAFPCLRNSFMARCSDGFLKWLPWPSAMSLVLINLFDCWWACFALPHER